MQHDEYQEFLQWLEFKRQRNQETTVVVTAEQPQLLLEQEPTSPPAAKFRQQTDAKNYKQKYTMLQNCCINDLLLQGWCYSDIGELLGRSGKAIKGQYLKHIKGTL